MSYGMLSVSQETSYIFIGYGEYRKCPKCNNQSNEIIRQYKFKQTLMYVVPLGTKHGNFWSTCSVCEQFVKIGKVGGLFGHDSGLSALTTKLMAGKELNKKYYEGLDAKSKDAFLKKLNSLKQYDLVAYIGGHP